LKHKDAPPDEEIVFDPDEYQPTADELRTKRLMDEALEMEENIDTIDFDKFMPFWKEFSRADDLERITIDAERNRVTAAKKSKKKN
jgi:hypothetical protein